KQWDNINDAIVKGVEKTGYLDVGMGVERQIGVPRSKFNSVVNQLVKEKGYYIHQVYVRRLSDPKHWTTVKVLSKEPDSKKVSDNSNYIRNLGYWSGDGCLTIKNIKKPEMVDHDRIHIRYAEDGGSDKDGLIELKPGVSDLDLGASRYAQVRIGAGKDLYLKGMAAYADSKDFPKGKDIIYNVTKNRGTPVEDTLKTIKPDI